MQRRFWAFLLAAVLFLPGLAVCGLIPAQPSDKESEYTPAAGDTDGDMSDFWWAVVDTLYASDDGEIFTFTLGRSRLTVPAGIIRVLYQRDAIVDLIEPDGNVIRLDGLKIAPIADDRTFVAVEVLRFQYDRADHMALYEQRLAEELAQQQSSLPSGSAELTELPSEEASDVMTDETPSSVPFTPSPSYAPPKPPDSGFDAFDDADNVISGTMQHSDPSSPMSSKPVLPEATPAAPPEQIPVEEPTEEPQTPKLSMGEVSYLVISIALLIPLGAGLLTYSILHKKDSET